MGLAKTLAYEQVFPTKNRAYGQVFHAENPLWTSFGPDTPPTPRGGMGLTLTNPYGQVLANVSTNLHGGRPMG